MTRRTMTVAAYMASRGTINDVRQIEMLMHDIEIRMARIGYIVEELVRRQHENEGAQ